MSRRSALAVAVLALAVGLIAWASGSLGPLERSTVDLRFRLHGTRRPSDVALVTIDDATFNALHGLHWPFPRRWHADAIDRLLADGAGDRL